MELTLWIFSIVFVAITWLPVGWMSFHAMAWMMETDKKMRADEYGREAVLFTVRMGYCSLASFLFLLLFNFFLSGDAFRVVPRTFRCYARLVRKAIGIAA